MSESHSPSDPNLIFGVLALQAGLITQAQFAEACAAWTTHRDVPLGQLLQQRGWLKPGDCAMIERLAGTPAPVNKAKHGVAPGSPGLFWTALTALLVLNVVVLLGCMGWMWLQLSQARQELLAVKADLVIADQQRSAAENERQQVQAAAQKFHRDVAERHKDQGLACLERRLYDLAVVELRRARELGRDEVTPQLVQALLKCGQQCLATRDPQQAVLDFSEALDLQPGHTEALLGRATAHRIAGRLSQALADLDQLLAKDERNAAAHLERGETYLLKREPRQALADFARAAALDPKSKRALLGRAAAHTALKDDAAAEADFQAALQLAPDDPAALYDEFALTYVSFREYEKAEPLLTRALELRKQKLGEDHPDVGDTLDNLGDLYFARGLYVRAAPFYDEALKVRRKESHPRDLRLPRTLDKLALVRRRQDQLDEAYKLYAEALDARKKLGDGRRLDVAVSLSNLAAVLLLRNEPAAAKKRLDEGLKLCQELEAGHSPEAAALQHTLGDVLLAEGNAAAARDAYQQALDVYRQQLGDGSPETAQAADSLGAALQALGEAEAARPLHERALLVLTNTYGPEDVQTLTAQEHLGTALYALGQYERAEQELRRALDGLPKAEAEKDPRWAGWRLNHAAAAARLGHFAEAVLAASAEAGRNPTPAMLYDVARVYALCAAAVDRDKDLKPDDRDKLTVTYIDEAVAVLTRLHGTGFFKPPERRERLMKDHDFDFLRDKAAFKALAEKLDER
jgi:tetratricopeptide (TPR) repeat protein